MDSFAGQVSNITTGSEPLFSPTTSTPNIFRRTAVPRLTFWEHTCYVDPTEGGHIGKVCLATCGGVEMSV